MHMGKLLSCCTYLLCLITIHLIVATYTSGTLVLENLMQACSQNNDAYDQHLTMIHPCSLRWRFTRAVAQALRNLFTYIFNEKSARALGDKITRQRYTLPYSYVAYALESYYGVRGRMEKPYPRTLSAGRAV